MSWPSAGKCRLPRGQRIDLDAPTLPCAGGHRFASAIEPRPSAAVLEEVPRVCPASRGFGFMVVHSGHSRVMNSSRFSSTRLTLHPGRLIRKGGSRNRRRLHQALRFLGVLGQRLALPVQQACQDLPLARSGFAADAEAERISRGARPRPACFRAGCERPAPWAQLEKRLIVEQRQRLQAACWSGCGACRWLSRRGRRRRSGPDAGPSARRTCTCRGGSGRGRRWPSSRAAPA